MVATLVGAMRKAARRIVGALNRQAYLRALKRRLPLPGLRIASEHASTPRAHARWLGLPVGQALIAPMWATLGIPGQWLGGVWVHVLVRGHGIGEALIIAVEAAAAEAGLEEIRLNVGVENAPARRLYEKLGYREAADPGAREAIEQHLRAQGHDTPQVLMSKRML